MTAGVLGAAIVAALVVNFAPAIVDRLREGSNPAVERFAFETEVFSLRPLQLVLPVPRPPDRRPRRPPGALRGPGRRHRGVVRGARRRRQRRPRRPARDAPAGGRSRPALRAATRCCGTRPSRRSSRCFFAMTGGLAPVVSFLISPQLHAWNRLSVFIAFFALLAVALLLDRLRGARSRGRSPRRCWSSARSTRRPAR